MTSTQTSLKKWQTNTHSWEIDFYFFTKLYISLVEGMGERRNLLGAAETTDYNRIPIIGFRARKP